MAQTEILTRPAQAPAPLLTFGRFLRAHPIILAGTIVLGVFIVIAIAAPWLTPDPQRMNPAQRFRAPSGTNWFGTDQVGRSTFARTLHGTQVSLMVGFSVALLTSIVGLAIGMAAGLFRGFDTLIMRIMDGLMAIPGILLAIAMMSLFGPSVLNVIIAITVTEVPRMARVVRSSVLVARELPYIEAARVSGVRSFRLMVRHLLPNVAAPVIVQATYVFAAAMLVEAILSFLGAGTPPAIPSWGNMLSEARTFLQRAPWLILFPSVMLSIVVLTINMMGDALRDAIDPRLARELRR